MQRTSILALFFVALCGVAFSPAASATPVTWYLDDVTFTGGGTASGEFTYNATTNTYSGIDITTSGGSFSGITYTSDLFGTSTILDMENGLRNLFLVFAAPLTNAGGAVNLGGSSTETNLATGDTRTASGEVSTTPEPASAALLGLGGGLLFLWRRRSSKVLSN